MANIQKYFSQVAPQNRVNEVSKTGATPIADTIGKIAGVGEEFYQRYKQAEYDRNKYDIINNINAEINKYKEYRKTNPILPNTPENGKQVPYHSKGDDIVTLKEQDWENQSKKIQGIIEKTADPRLKEDMTKWWVAQSEQIRHSVVDNALNENIAYMNNRAKEDVMTFVYNGQYDSAVQRTVDALNSGVITRDEADELNDTILYSSVIDQASRQDTIEGVKRVIEESPLEANEKIKAQKYVTERMKLEEQARKKYVEDYSNKMALDMYNGVMTGRINSIGQLDSILSNIPDPEYNGKKIDGVGANIAKDNMVKLYAALKAKLKEGDGIKEESRNIELDIALTTKTRTEFLNMLWDKQAKGEIDSATSNYYYKLTNSTAFSRLNDNQKKDFEKSLNDKNMDWSTEEKAQIRRRWEDFVSTFSNRDKFVENYYNHMNDFFKNMKEDTMKVRIDDFSKSLREEGNMSKVTEPEKFLKELWDGNLTGLLNVEGLNRYIATGDDKRLREDTAQYLYNRPMKDLDGKEKRKVELTVAMAYYSKELQRTADQEIRNGSVVRIIPPGFPVVVYPNGETYTLKLEDKEEAWYKYMGEKEDGTYIWEPTSIPVPKIDKSKGLIKTAVENMRNMFSKEYGLKQIDTTGVQGIPNVDTKNGTNKMIDDILEQWGLEGY